MTTVGNRALITGAGGQLATELVLSQPQQWEALALTEKELDITDSAAVEEHVRHYRPNVIVNTAAFTAVDEAEKEVERAFDVNAKGPAVLAAAAATMKSRLIQVSTDYVFSGTQDSPYSPKTFPRR